MDKIERVIAISEYLNERYTCLKCGQVLSGKEVKVRETQFQNYQTRFGADCPDCSTFIRWMPTNIVGRVFWKGSMEEIAKFDTGQLQWMLRVNYGNSATLKRNIDRELLTRLNKPPVVRDAFVDQRKERELKVEFDKKTEKESILEKYNLALEQIKTESHNWGHVKVQMYTRKMKILKRKLEKL